MRNQDGRGTKGQRGLFDAVGGGRVFTGQLTGEETLTWEATQSPLPCQGVYRNGLYGNGPFS